jgi:spore maturation protein CgeB
LVPLEAASLRKLRKIGITTINYSTDDPWNPHIASRWFQRSLPEYDVICTPRRANIGDFERLGCRDVRYLPFGYDERLLAPGAAALGYDVLFVGGADADRARFVRQFRRHGVPVTLVGGYWHRYRDLRSHALGMKSWAEVAALTRAAKISLCLVRRANRDGHVMRSLEIAACGGCMLAEDTADHRAFFGPDGETVRYFTGAEDAARRAHALLLDSVARQALAERLRLRILRGKHTYADRLASMLQAASSAMRRRSVGAGAALRC